MWSDVEQFLISSKDLWDNEILDEWLEEVRGEHTPAFDDA